MPRRRSVARRSTRARTSRKRTTSSRRRGISRSRRSLAVAIDSRVSREIIGVIWIALAVVTFFAVQGSAGVFGEWFNQQVLAAFFGLGAPVVPLIFAGIGMAYLIFEKIEYRGARALGLLLLFASILGILHLSAPTEKMFDVASQYGGYIGFVSSFMTLAVFGEAVTGFVLGFFALVGFFLLFQFSLREFIVAIVHFVRSTKKEVGKSDDAKQSGRTASSKSRVAEISETDDNELSEDEVNIIRGIEQAVEKAGTQQIVHDKTAEPTVADTVKAAQKQEAPKVIDNTKFNTDKGAYVSGDFSGWKFPPLDLLVPQSARSVQDDSKLLADAETIRKKLAQFGINVLMKDINVGPTVIQYTLKPAEDVKLSKITTLKNDLALSLAAKAIRIEAPVPGRSLVGIEIPTAERATVTLRDIFDTKEFTSIKDPLRLVLGRDVTGKSVNASLVKMPHLLVAGQTGSGKSVAINTFMISLLYKHSPADLKLILVDPKRVELEGYNGIPHLLTPVITEPEKALKALKWAVAEMTRRYKEFSHRRKKNIFEYNSDKALEHMPYIVIVIDELADLMMAAPKEIEATICRIAQMARAVGIHLIIATQRPSVDVITGLIKANIPTRIAFTVATGIDSRTILDGIGAEDLLNRGDMLYLASDVGKPVRVQGAFVSSEEIDRVINFVKLSSPDAIEYLDEITEGDHKVSIPGMPESKNAEDNGNDIQQAIEVIKQYRKASASLLQRRCSFGYAKAARILDELESMGLIGPSNGAKPREIYMEE